MKDTAAVNEETICTVCIFYIKARFFSVSFMRRSRRWRGGSAFRLCQRQRVVDAENMLMVGSSTLIKGSASGFSASAIVSPILKSKLTTAQGHPQLHLGSFAHAFEYIQLWFDFSRYRRLALMQWVGFARRELLSSAYTPKER